MYITEKEYNALIEVEDFLTSNSQSAEDREYYDDLDRTLVGLISKARRQIQKQENDRALKYAKKIIAKRANK